MSWLVWLMLAVVLTGLAAITGLQPKGGRPVSGTRLMGVARFVLFLLAAVFAYTAFVTRSS